MDALASQHKKANRLKGQVNAIPNLIWSIACFTPVTIFWVQQRDLWLLGSFIALSFVPVFVNKMAFSKFQIGTGPVIYKMLGVNLINRFTQNGEIVNKLIKRRFPEYKVVSTHKRSIIKLVNQTYMFERFHWMMLVFFSLTFAKAIVTGSFYWAVIILVVNIIYNVYPILLQQYIRIKLIAIDKKIN